MTSSRELPNAGIVLDVFVLELRRKFGGEVIHLHDHSANARDQKIVAEHRRDRDAERRHGGDERARNARRHRRQIRRTGDGDIGEGVHHAPNRAEQTEKRRTTDGRCEQNHLRFKLECRFPDGALHRGADRIHLRRGDFVGDTETGAKSFIYFRRAKQMKREFLTTRPVNIKDRCADKARISLEQAQGLSVLSERFEKARRLFSGESDYAHFCDHDRPTKDRADGESQENDLSRDGGMFKSEKEPTAREEFREQNQRQVELINNVFRKKRKCCALEHGLLACAPSGHFVRCVGKIQRSATPLGAQTESLCSARPVIPSGARELTVGHAPSNAWEVLRRLRGSG
jgi:hypothetical protein